MYRGLCGVGGCMVCRGCVVCRGGWRMWLCGV